MSIKDLVYPAAARGVVNNWRFEHGRGQLRIEKESELAFMATCPILVINGVNGSGKSLLAAELCRRSLEAGRPVLSTARLLDYENRRECPGGDECDDPANHFYDKRVHGAAHPLYTRWTRWGQVDEMGTRFDLWADEITGVAGSRDTSALPKYAQDLFAQLRRRDAALRVTGIAFERADVLIREVAQGVVNCRGYVSRVDTESGRRYPRKRMFRWRMYGKDQGDVTRAALLDAGPVAESWFWGPGSTAFGCYDTLAPVARIGRIAPTGICEVCEGSKRRHECTCAEYVADRAGRRAGSPPGGRAVLAAVQPFNDGQEWAR